MHTLFSVYFADRVITLDVERDNVTYHDDKIYVGDLSDADWCFERRHVLYSMLSEVTDEQFASLSEPQADPEPEPTAGRRKSRTLR